MRQQQGRPPEAPVDNYGQALTSTKIGIVMLAAWILPLAGFPLGAFGLIMGLVGLNSSRKDLARSGIFLNGLGLVLSTMNITVSLYLLLSGKIDPFQLLQ